MIVLICSSGERGFCENGLDHLLFFFPTEVEADTDIQSRKVKELKADLDKLKVCRYFVELSIMCLV